MKGWQKVLIPTLIAVTIGGLYVFFVMQARKDPGVIGRNQQTRQLTKDELAVMKQFTFASFEAAKQLEGMTVWVKAGYSLPYYPYAGGKVEFAKRVGELPSAEKLVISKMVKAVAPAKENNRVPHGDRQYFVVFTLPEEKDAAGKTFAAPIGALDGMNEVIFADQLFYYDDPRTIYDHWPKDVWDAVAAHTPRVGLTENQTMMAVGILVESDSQSIGDRTVTYHAGAKTWRVTFVKGVATGVTAG